VQSTGGTLPPWGEGLFSGEEEELRGLLLGVEAARRGESLSVLMYPSCL